MKKLTQTEFIEKCENTHGDKYDYSLVNYVNSKTKVKIICKIHGVFEQRPKAHKEGQNCPKCSGKYKMNTKEFIEKSKLIYGDKYDYSLLNYINSKSKIKLINNKTGEIFEQFPKHHLNGHVPIRINTDIFIKRSKEIHGDKYDYSLVNYINSQTKIKLIDKEFGFVFEQIPAHHLKGFGSNGVVTLNKFIKKSQNIHNYKYDYSLITEINSGKDIVKIVCPIHGIFKQSVSNHMNLKHNCPKCSHNYKYTQEDFIKKCEKIHNYKYDYSLVNYTGIDNKIKIICQIHGVFTQSASKHLNNEQGCPECTNKSKGENKIFNHLIRSDIKFITQKTFDNCINEKKLRYDFFIPGKNILIEYDGIQHFKSVKYFGGENYLLKRQKIDEIKNKYAKDNNIYLIRIPYTEYKNIEEILINEKII